MAAAEVFGSRHPVAVPRESEHLLKEKACKSGYFPKVRKEPLANQLRAQIAAFENNAQLMSLL